MKNNNIPKEFRTEKCLRNLYTAPNSGDILERIETRQQERELLKNITT